MRKTTIKRIKYFTTNALLIGTSLILGTAINLQSQRSKVIYAQENFINGNTKAYHTELSSMDKVIEFINPDVKEQREAREEKIRLIAIREEKLKEQEIIERYERNKNIETQNMQLKERHEKAYDDLLEIRAEQKRIKEEQERIKREQEQERRKQQAAVSRGKRYDSPINKGTFVATAYDMTPQSQGKWGSKVASGKIDLKGHSRQSARCIAVDPKVIPLGSIVEVTIPGMPEYSGEYIAYDTGGAIKGNKIDIFMGSGNVKQTVRNFGRRHGVTIKIKGRAW